MIVLSETQLKAAGGSILQKAAEGPAAQKTVNFMILYWVWRFRGSKVDESIGAQPRPRIFKKALGKT
jgi:hypothetical protein